MRGRLLCSGLLAILIILGATKSLASVSLKLGDWRWSIKGKYIEVDGIIENTGSEPACWVKLNAVLRDANNKFIGTGFTFSDPKSIAPGGWGRYTMYVEGHNPTGTLRLKVQFEWRRC